MWQYGLKALTEDLNVYQSLEKFFFFQLSSNFQYQEVKRQKSFILYQ